MCQAKYAGKIDYSGMRYRNQLEVADLMPIMKGHLKLRSDRRMTDYDTIFPSLALQQLQLLYSVFRCHPEEAELCRGVDFPGYQAVCEVRVEHVLIQDRKNAVRTGRGIYYVENGVGDLSPA